MLKLIAILIKSVVFTVIAFALVNLFYFAYAYYQADMTGAIEPDWTKGVLLLDKKPTGLPIGDIKTHGFLGFVFVLMFVREYIKGGALRG